MKKPWISYFETFFYNFSIKTELSEIREKASISGGRYKQNQRFEEMRRLQETLAQEKKEWVTLKETMDQEVQAKKAEMHKYQVISFFLNRFFWLLR